MTLGWQNWLQWSLIGHTWKTWSIRKLQISLEPWMIAGKTLRISCKHVWNMQDDSALKFYDLTKSSIIFVRKLQQPTPQEALVWWNAWRSQQCPLWRLFLFKIFLAQARNIWRIWPGRSHAWSCFTLLCRASHWKWCQECMNSNRKKLQIFLGRWRP